MLAACLAGAAVLLALSGPAPAQVVTYFDDFNDGDATDGIPETWVPYPVLPGDYNATSGDYILTPGNELNDDDSMAALVEDKTFTDVSVRTRAKTIIYDGNVGTLARFDFDTFSGYVGLIDSSDNLILIHYALGAAVEEFSFQESFPGLNALQDVIFQLDAFGDTISVSAWYPGDPQPLPQMVKVDPDPLTSGTTGIVYNEDDEEIFPSLPAGAFRWATAASARIINGDMDYSGAPNGLDVDPFVAAVIAGVYAPPADINGDGAVNGLDVEPFVDAVIAGGPVAHSVPEPSTLLLTCIGLIALAGFVAQRKSS